MSKIKGIIRRGLVAAGVPVVALFVLAAVAFALSDGPEERDDHQDGGGISHASTVYYTRQLIPFIAWVDRVYYGGRPEDLSSNPNVCCGEWRRDKTEYKRWTGSSWKTVKTLGSSMYHVTGSPGNLSYYNLNNDVTLTGGAYVRQHLRYRNTVDFPVLGTYNFPGGWNSHFLE